MPGATVLVVEDDDALADILTTLMSGHGVPVLRVTNADEALRAAIEARPGAMVLDLDLGDSSGFDVVAGLRRHPQTATLPVVVYSAEDVDPERRPELTLGPTVFVTKGRVDPAGVEDRVLDLLQRNSPVGGAPA